MDLPDEMERSVYREAEAPAAVSIMECSGDTEIVSPISFQTLARKETKPMAVEPITAPKAAQAAADWSEETVRTWAKYDVVSENHAEEGRGHPLSGIER